MGIWHTDGSPNLSQKTRPYNNQQKKEGICKIVDFAVPADHRIKLKECEKKDKYLDLARELKKTMEHEGDNYTNCDWCFWYSNYRTIKRNWRTWKLSDKWRPSKLTHYWKHPEYWEESLRLDETCCHSNSNERPSAKTDMKISQGVNNNNDNNKTDRCEKKDKY